MTPKRSNTATPAQMAPVLPPEATGDAARDTTGDTTGDATLVTHGMHPDMVRWLAIAIIVFVVALSVLLLFNPAWIIALGSWGYVGAFLINLLASASLFLPIPGLPIAIAMSVALNPLLLAAAAGLGSAFGELAGYAVGYSGRTITHSERAMRYAARLEEWTLRFGAYAIFVIAVLPLPFDLAGIAAGVSRMQIWRYFVATMLGKFVKYYVIILAASGSMAGLRRYFGW